MKILRRRFPDPRSHPDVWIYWVLFKKHVLRRRLSVLEKAVLMHRFLDWAVSV